eukprot:TRINITY_DN2318_c0_g1_i1.p1 TRINITY_DN2318_c0_g1~~TRINITY_DN2318_c0_g1_i1.p1  ORF type:complete len:234 (-),score=33.63 TRINITY_DN2318_c0_g1_i1:277-978(-)
MTLITEVLVQIRCTAKKPAGFYERRAAMSLTGAPAMFDPAGKRSSESSEARRLLPADLLELTGAGSAVNSAVSAAAHVEAQGLGTITAVETACIESLSGRESPHVKITVKKTRKFLPQITVAQISGEALTFDEVPQGSSVSQFLEFYQERQPCELGYSYLLLRNEQVLQDTDLLDEHRNELNFTAIVQECDSESSDWTTPSSSHSWFDEPHNEIEDMLFGFDMADADINDIHW